MTTALPASSPSPAGASALPTATVQTVLGPVDPATLGRVMVHEHPLSLAPGPWTTGGGDVDEHAIALAASALAPLLDHGIDVVVDLSPYGVVGRADHGENIELLAEVSRRSGVHIVAGTSVYLEAFSPAWTVDAGLDAMAERMSADLTRGIAGTAVRAGVLGEQATGLGAITPHEDKCLRAAARAHLRTGAAIMTHTTHGTMALEQVAILRDEGADLSRVVIGHMDIQPDIDVLAAVLEMGACLALDTIGKQHWDFFLAPQPTPETDGEYGKRGYFRSDLSRARILAELWRRGYGDQILLAQDLTGAEVSLNPTTHGQWGYAYLPAVFLPLAMEHGLPPEAADTLLRSTPLRLLTLGGGS
ncbi:phosphotriesterase [Demequina sp. NBRC 110056]|uniref:phosphotriesterase family protein n=1 Tax=Demequina sp. NBRC 110056 TaxID=1570345 RepID=UPI00190EE673|nr:hypothetical protein [Demequina sp. NBRC 110056]